MTVSFFVSTLWSFYFPEKPLPEEELFRYAHVRGWIEDQDERFCNESLNRQTAARIVHEFMRIELGVPDLPDISGANVLADLYTCHACVNHIAQVYLRGIIKSQTVVREGAEYKIFNHLEQLTDEEITFLFLQLPPKQTLEKI